MFHKTHEASDKGQEGGPFESDSNSHTMDDTDSDTERNPAQRKLATSPLRTTAI